MEPNRPTLPRNGCYDRAPIPGSYSSQQFGWQIANPMTKDCQYSRTTADPRCDGCVWQQELEA